MEALKDKFQEVLTAPRFWAMIMVTVAIYLENYGFSIDPIGLAEWLRNTAGGFVTIGTIDRFAEKSGSNDTGY